MRDVLLCLCADTELYTMESSTVHMPLLAPGLEVPVEIGLTCEDPDSGASGSVTALICSKSGNTTLARTDLSMPVSECKLE